MSKYYGLWLTNSQSYATSGGRLIIHHVRGEMEFLFPNTQIREVWVNPDPEKTIALQFVPGLEGIEFPLRKEDFR